jgi:hypothetical protein
MTTQEVLHDRVIDDPVDTSELSVDESAQVDHGVPLVPARSLGISTLA